MRTLTVAAQGQSYPIHIGAGLLGCASEHLAGFAGRRCAVVTDETVGPLYAGRLAAQLDKLDVQSTILTVQQGEGSKSLAVLERLYGELAAHRVTRDGFIVALGGGVVGDLAGFAAATWLRGVPFVQVPTTLLAQVDSSVGGKVAVNIDAGKNLAGAFYQPRVVLIDPSVIDTLEPRDMASGMAEVIKYGAIADAALFGALETGDVPREELIYRCCAIKAGYVRQDALDTGVRAQLNFGHTLGHALEKLGGYGVWRHGEAVAVGMVHAARWGEALGVTRSGCAQRLESILTRHGLPTQAEFDAGLAIGAMMGDKKATEGGVTLVLLRDIGEATTQHISSAELERLVRT